MNDIEFMRLAKLANDQLDRISDLIKKGRKDAKNRAESKRVKKAA
ncbi:hypothetical protein [Spongiibacter pelagi]|nr:hypothetical protein [Spongiibacter pelagi]